jgi:triphosphoribosyl-dephospho-CoA synthase
MRAFEPSSPIIHWPLILAAQAACILEADAPKVGNVSRYHDFADTKLEDFHISALLIGPLLNDTLTRGVGQTVLAAAEATRQRVTVNTNLGILLLLCPLAAAWLSMQELPQQTGRQRAHYLQCWREETRKVLDNLTVADTEAVYQAIRLAAPGGLGSVAAYDVQGEDKPGINLLEAMCLSAKQDMIGAEYKSNFSLVFTFALPALEQALVAGLSMAQAIVQAHVRLLAQQGDTLICRKLGREAMDTVRVRAQAACELGGLLSEAGQKAIEELDAFLRCRDNSYNPGSTADIMAAALFVFLLAGESYALLERGV